MRRSSQNFIRSFAAVGISVTAGAALTSGENEPQATMAPVVAKTDVWGQPITPEKTAYQEWFIDWDNLRTFQRPNIVLARRILALCSGGTVDCEVSDESDDVVEAVISHGDSTIKVVTFVDVFGNAWSPVDIDLFTRTVGTSGTVAVEGYFLSAIDAMPNAVQTTGFEGNSHSESATYDGVQYVNEWNGRSMGTGSIHWDVPKAQELIERCRTAIDEALTKLDGGGAESTLEPLFLNP